MTWRALATGRCVAKGPPKLLARAFARAEARLFVTRSGVQPSFEELLAEAAVELRAMVALRAERDRRGIRKAARRLRQGDALVELVEALVLPAGPDADPVPDGVPREWSGPPGPPSWHPEHRLNEEA
jgi:hypothetical protein